MKKEGAGSKNQKEGDNTPDKKPPAKPEETKKPKDEDKKTPSTTKEDEKSPEKKNDDIVLSIHLTKPGRVEKIYVPDRSQIRQRNIPSPSSIMMKWDDENEKI